MRKLLVACCIWSVLVLCSGCGRKTKPAASVPSEASSEPRAAVQESEGVELQGEPAAAALMEIDEEVITTSDVLSALAEPLQQLGRNANPAQFRLQAEKLIGQFLRQRTGEILLLNKAQTSLNQNENAQIDARVQAYREQLLRDCSGSPTRLQRKLREQGTTLAEELDRFNRDLQIRIFLQRQFSSRIHISRQDIVAYYNQHRGQYNSPRKVELLKIQVLTHKHIEPGQTLQEAEDRVRQIAEQAWDELAGGEPFAAVAQKYSDSLRDQGGNWGPVDPLSLQDASERRAAQTLKAGEYSKVLDTEIGSCIVGVGKIIPAQQKSLEEVQEQIRQLLWNQQYNRLYNQRLSELSRRAVISVSPAAMQMVVDLAQRRFMEVR